MEEEFGNLSQLLQESWCQVEWLLAGSGSKTVVPLIVLISTSRLAVTAVGIIMIGVGMAGQMVVRLVGLPHRRRVEPGKRILGRDFWVGCSSYVAESTFSGRVLLIKSG